jgi:hypothetical protein
LAKTQSASKVSPEEFITRAITKLRKPGYKGIHTVYSGFNAAFEDYFGHKPDDLTRPEKNKDNKPAGTLLQKGVISSHFTKGGCMLYLAADAPASSATVKVLSQILG